jgi:3D (Asp-Asp-Asp) domain-containing protein
MFIGIIIGCVCRKNINKHTDITDKTEETQSTNTETNDVGDDCCVPVEITELDGIREETDIEASTSEPAAPEDEATVEEAEVEKVDNSKLINLGNFKLTAYCSCAKCCGKFALNRPIDEYGNEIVYGSIGTRLTAGISIAVDPSVIPYGSNVVINGHTYTAHDTGGAIKGNRIDVYFDSHKEALNFGVKYADVYMEQ